MPPATGRFYHSFVFRRSPRRLGDVLLRRDEMSVVPLFSLGKTEMMNVHEPQQHRHDG